LKLSFSYKHLNIFPFIVYKGNVLVTLH